MACTALADAATLSRALFPTGAARSQWKVKDRRVLRCRVRADTTATEKLGIKVVRNPPESELADLGVRQWPKYFSSTFRPSRFDLRPSLMATLSLSMQSLHFARWGCPPSKFPWTYTAKETCYLLEGKVKVFPEGQGDEFVEIQAGDLVEFPRGLSCTWDVSVAVDKHYNFE
ncbi:hypothetical protein ZIOFF_020608 [Zingiber officinale]|uniref:(S)-ureidoglycine aminohydrolase cupin domain-containing protein n=1 Tax=Zingiber officinale TaxID=94328 RepID=A0A8J5H0G2_ZINOF|nr:hypothetical protein ZIOFF_020608 [Zingiber officinale]